MHVRNLPARPRHLPDIYEDFLADSQYAEEIGFDSIWLTEYHFSEDQRLPSPFPFLAAIAARTDRIRLGTAVLCLPYHDPLRVAEDAAVVDNLSDGRLNLGIAVGSTPGAFETFCISPRERFGRTLEAAALIERCFYETEPFDHDGKYFHYRSVLVTTKPVQARVPIWWGGTGPQGVRRAAKRGYNLLAMSRSYDEALVQAGRDPKDFGTTESLVMHLADTRDRAWDEAKEGLRWHCEFSLRHTGAISTDDGPLNVLPPAGQLRNLKGLRRFPGETPFIIGTPDDALELLLPLRDGRKGRLTQLIFSCRLAGVESPKVRRSLALFAEHCMPELRAKAR
jgi:alkanesulfonate monooxygenase SsuD/methylene tetrahydromethanopterin reductase-like flavin-dependent oxidoreductase (luciferase family)